MELHILATQSVTHWPLAAYFLVVIALAAGIIVISYFLGQRHRERATGLPYESGIIPTGSARLKFPAEFYLVAMFFLIFDLESVFVFAWAVDVRGLGWAGFIEIVIFIGVLLATLLYLWRMGALDCGTSRKLKERLAARKAVEGSIDAR